MFMMNVGGVVEMNITFLSPLTPGDQKRQSLIFTYLDVAVESLDGKPHNVQLYTDISAGKPCHLCWTILTDTSRMGCRRSLICCAMGV